MWQGVRSHRRRCPDRVARKCCTRDTSPRSRAGRPTLLGFSGGRGESNGRQTTSYNDRVVIGNNDGSTDTGCITILGLSRSTVRDHDREAESQHRPEATER
jgi:hypothetical protein